MNEYELKTRYANQFIVVLSNCLIMTSEKRFNIVYKINFLSKLKMFYAILTILIKPLCQILQDLNFFI